MTIPSHLQLRPHHRDAIETVIHHYQGDPQILAIIIGGSVAKERAREDSDIDATLVVTPQEYARRREANKLAFCDPEMFNYPGGYLDAKVVDLSWLRDAAERGSEPTRNAFFHAFVAHTKITGLPALLEEIARYPEELRQERIDSFWAQICLYRLYFWQQSEIGNDAYLRARCVSEITLYAGRMMLAYNRILFPSHKELMNTLARAPELPAGFMDHMHALLTNQTRENMEALCDCVEKFTAWQFQADLYTRFIDDVETTWRSRKPALSDI